MESRVTGFDRIVIGVTDLDEACAEYSSLLGIAPSRYTALEAEPAALLPLANTTLHLLERGGSASRIEGLVFRNEAASGRPTRLVNDLGLNLTECDGSETALFRNEHPEAILSRVAVDHVVLRTNHADACIGLFNGVLGIRLALDQDVPEWGGRMLFFRTGKLTLEVLAVRPESSPAEASAFWGITYQCEDIDAMAVALKIRGVGLSEIRAGRKPGTRVATIKSHCLDLPTLLIGPALT
jgi:catechol 2,3-dioxygenase-like lactoylglutathione lyase family enzyme